LVAIGSTALLAIGTPHAARVAAPVVIPIIRNASLLVIISYDLQKGLLYVTRPVFS
jgi:hypothetical protein